MSYRRELSEREKELLHDNDMIAKGFKKIRSEIIVKGSAVPAKYAIRFLPNYYPLAPEEQEIAVERFALEAIDQ